MEYIFIAVMAWIGWNIIAPVIFVVTIISAFLLIYFLGVVVESFVKRKSQK